MEQIRKPFQGVNNIVRFNWHYYLFTLIFIASLCALSIFLEQPFNYFVLVIAFLAFSTALISLLTSFYIYDLAGIYNLNWIDNDFKQKPKLIININAGFDETSILLSRKFKDSQLRVYDFYNPEKHTEISIERARKAYPPFPVTEVIETNTRSIRMPLI